MKNAFFVIVLALVVVVSGCASVTDGEVQVSRSIELSDFEFSPNLITVKKGDVIRFVNMQGAHTVTIEELQIDKVLNAGESFTVEIEKGGTFVLTCRFHLHLGMMGVVSTEEITEDVETIVKKQAEERAAEAKRIIEKEISETPSGIQEFNLVQTVYPGKFEPSVITATKGIPVRIYISTTQREHINRVSILPWVESSSVVAPGSPITIEFTPDQVGEFTIRNIGHGFEATLIVE